MALAVLLVAALQAPWAESRSSALQVRVNVVRSCSVDTRGASEQGTIALTCSRGTAAGVISMGVGASTRIIAIPARQTTFVPTRPTATAANGPATRLSARQIVTVNF